MLSFRDRWLRLLWVLLPLGLLVLHATGALRQPWVDALERWVDDARLRAALPATRDERIVIIDIDEASLAAYGRWPWPRARIAQLLRELQHTQGAAVIGLDMVFAEPEAPPVPPELQRWVHETLTHHPTAQRHWHSLLAQHDGDAQLAQALSQHPIVLGYYLSSDRTGHRSGALPAPLFDLRAHGLQGLPLLHFDGHGANLPTLAAAAGDAGFLNALPDEDGSIRAVPLLAELDDRVYASFALAIWRAHLGPGTLELLGPHGPLWQSHHPSPHSHPPTGAVPSSGMTAAVGPPSALRIRQGPRSWTIPLDGRGAVLVPYRGAGGPAGGSFRYISASDILDKRLPPQSLTGRLVLVGTTAPGLWDMRVTPVGTAYPGVEVHANILSALLDQRWRIRPDYAPGYELALLLLVGLLLALTLPRLGAAATLTLVAALAAGLLALNLTLAISHQLVLPVVSGLLLVGAAGAVSAAHGYLAETRAKRRLAQLFGTYVPPELVQRMLRQPGAYDMQAQEREVTVLFCDLRGFTTLAERQTPAQTQALLNRVLSALSAVVRRHGGTIDKFIGDCIMAFWGAPLEDPAHAHHATAAALDMQRAINALNRELAASGTPPLGMGIGLNTGRVSVGDMGSDDRRAYTVVGDAVNVAARLEALTRAQGVVLLAGAATAGQAPAYPWQPVGKFALKGKGQPITAYTLPPPAPESSD